MKKLLIAVVLLCASAQNAYAKQPAEEFIWNELAVVRANPLGLNFDGTLEYRLRLYDADHDALSTNYISIAGKPIITPAFTRLGLRAEIMPLSVLRLGVQYEFVQYFGTFDFLQSYESGTAEWDPDTYEASADAGNSYATNGEALTVMALLQMKVGPIAARSKFQLTQNAYKLNEGDEVYYDPYIDLMMPKNGWYWQNEADLLYFPEGGRLIAGVRHTMIRSFLPDIEPEDDPNSPVHRLGPLILYQFYRKDTGLLRSMRALGLFQWYLQHRYRAGQANSQAIPYMGFGLVFEGSFLD